MQQKLDFKVRKMTRDIANQESWNESEKDKISFLQLTQMVSLLES